MIPKQSYFIFLRIKDVTWFKSYCKKLKLEDALIDRKGLTLFPILNHFVTLMEKALGKRIRTIAMKPLEVPKVTRRLYSFGTDVTIYVLNIEFYVLSYITRNAFFFCFSFGEGVGGVGVKSFFI